jgi:hypothetical protein
MQQNPAIKADKKVALDSNPPSLVAKIELKTAPTIGAVIHVIEKTNAVSSSDFLSTFVK